MWQTATSAFYLGTAKAGMHKGPPGAFLAYMVTKILEELIWIERENGKETYNLFLLQCLLVTCPNVEEEAPRVILVPSENAC